MKILYTAMEGGYWLPLNIDQSIEQLKEYCELNKKTGIDTHNRILINGGGINCVYAAAIMFSDGTIWDDIICDYDKVDPKLFDSILRRYNYER